ncbi:hypothetical protein [Streptomyces roseolus]|uniref:hypothetical protein n=1 Tax=Streptomyces roseolus TaxID=67358 RepID=UPI0036525F98
MLDIRKREGGLPDGGPARPATSRSPSIRPPGRLAPPAPAASIRPPGRLAPPAPAASIRPPGRLAPPAPADPIRANG